jgi:methylenetetrahydrofolate reductase (NADPH)
MIPREVGENEILLTPHKVRAGPDIIAAYFQGQYPDIPFAPHFICGGFTKRETENAAVQLPFVGIQNLILIRGDPNYETVFKPEEGGHEHADGLITQITAMEQGKFLEHEGDGIRFCKGFAGYPQTHYASPNLDTCVKRLVRKQESGGDFLITQMCLDTDAILRFRDKCQQYGITVPIMPGLKVVTRRAQLDGEKGLPAEFRISVPQALYDSLLQYDNPQEFRAAGVRWAVEQSERLYAEGFPIVHFFTSSTNSTIPVLEALGFQPK